MNCKLRIGSLVVFVFAASLGLFAHRAAGQDEKSVRGPAPGEIPVPPIETSLGKMPGPDELPTRTEMPDVMTMNDGTKVTTPEQWQKRRAEMKKILEYYAVGLAPPPPGNVKGTEVKSQLVMNGKVKYRLIHLTFGPQESLSLDVGIFTPAEGGPFPAIITPSSFGGPPGGTSLERVGRGQTAGIDILLKVGPPPANAPQKAVTPTPASDGANPPATGNSPAKGGESPATRPASDKESSTADSGSSKSAAPDTAPAAPAGRGAGRGSFGFGRGDAESVAAKNRQILDHGYAYVIFDNNDCGEDTTLRNADGSWAFRNKGFYPAYPGYDWGLLRGWAWGVSRIVDYLETDPSIDKTKLIVTGVSRTGKSALIAGAFDERIAMVAPVASSGGGTPAYRFSGIDRGGKEGLSDMMRKYPNWFGPHLHDFWGKTDKLPFDEHWFIALAAPRPFIALEGSRDQNVCINGVRQSWLAAQPAYQLLCGSTDKVGVSWADRMHGLVQGDWDAMFAFADKHMFGKPVDRKFDQFPEESASAPAAPAATPNP